MRIIIIGAGDAGLQLAEQISKEKHDVVVVDNDQAPLDIIEAQLDTLTIRGPGSSPHTLQEAELHRADLLVAVTNCDEVNILAGIYARQAGVQHTVVRVSNVGYMSREGSYSLKELGIDLVVSQEGECANELANIIRLPGSTEVVDLLGGRIQAVGLRVHFDSPLIRQPLMDFPEKDLLTQTRFIATLRGEELFIPRGDTQFMIGDLVYFLGPADVNARMLDYIDPEHLTIERVVIGGGNDLGFHLAQKLECKARDTVLLEADPEKAEHCATLLNRTLVIKGDAMTQENLESANLNDKTAFVATGNDDENNIISCLLADSMGAALTLAQITTSDYIPIINSSSLLDRAVSPHSAMINAILRFIRGRNIESATLLKNVPGELLEVTLDEKSRGLDKAISDIKMPNGAIIGAIVRDGQVSVATGDSVLQKEDHLLIFTKRAKASKVEAIFRH